MMTESSIQAYADAAREFLAGKEISTSLFSSLELPEVPDHIALIPVNGAMTKADICGGAGTKALSALINEAVADKSKEAIILYFESVPGGQVDGTELFANTIKAATKNKPVISAISGMCCSAGVWAASQSSEIYATSMTDQIGCIGVMARLRNPEMNKDIIEVVSDLSPDKNNEFKDVQILKDMYLNPVAALFQTAVKEGRGKSLKDGDKVLTGGTFISAEAKKHGLIDGTLPFSKIIQRANYLIKKSNSNPMSATKKNTATADNFPFQNILKAAGAEAMIPVEEGFAMSEEHLTALESQINALNTAAETVTDASAALTDAEAMIATLETTVAERDATIVERDATIESYTGDPARVVADPTVKKDDEPDPKEKHLTSVDAEAAKLYEEF